MVYTIKDVQNIYIGENIIPTEEYVMLSDWGSTNRYSELSLNGRQCINNATTYWQWYVNATDTFWLHYKQFDKKIVWFEVIAACTGNSYDEWNFFLSSDGAIGWGNIKYFNNWIEFSANSTEYGWSSTWTIYIWEIVSGTWTQKFKENKNNSTTRVTITWTLEGWTWNFSIITGTWQSWTTSFTPNSVNTDLYYMWVRSGRWYTWQASNFYQIKFTLQS